MIIKEFGFLTVMFVSLLQVAWGQDRQKMPTVSVKVVDCFSGHPIGWATMWSFEEGRLRAQKVSYVQPDGTITLRAPRSGSYKLMFRAEGYLTDSLLVTFLADTTLGVIKLFPDLEMPSFQLDVAVVSAERPLLTHVVDRWVYDVSRDPEARRKKMSEMIEKIPQINALTADGRLEYGGQKIRQILINGERHEMINSAIQYPMQMIRADVMDKIELIPPGSLQYDNSEYFLNIITARPLPNGYAAEIKGFASTNNSYLGSVDVVSKIRDKMVFRFAYNVDYGSSPKLNSYSLREQYALEKSMDTSIESETESFSDLSKHNFSFRGSAKPFGRNLTFGVRTAYGQRNVYTDVFTKECDAEEGVLHMQATQTKFTNQSLPTLNGDIRLVINQSRDRTTNFSYQCSGLEEENLRRQTFSDMLSTLLQTDQDDREQFFHRASRTHTLLWSDNMKIGKSSADVPFAGHRLKILASYNHRRYQQTETIYDLLVGGLEYKQQVIDLRPSYSFRYPSLHHG